MHADSTNTVSGYIRSDSNICRCFSPSEGYDVDQCGCLPGYEVVMDEGGSLTCHGIWHIHNMEEVQLYIIKVS